MSLATPLPAAPTIDSVPPTASGTHAPSGTPARGDLRRAVRLLDLSWARFAAAALLGTLAMAASVGLSASAAWLIARAAQMPPVLDLTVGTVAVRAFGVSRAALRYAERLVSHEVALRGMGSLREQLYRRLAAGRPEALAGLRRGDVLARTGADVDTVGDVVVRAYLPMTVAALTGLVTVAIVGLLLPSAGVVLASCQVASGAAAVVLAGGAAARAQRDHVAGGAQLSAAALTLLEDAGELAVSGRLERARAHLDELETEVARAADRRARPVALAQAADTAALGVAVLGALALGVPATQSGQLSAVGLAVVVLTPLASFEATAQLGAAASQLARSRAAASRIVALLDSAAPEGCAADHDDAAGSPPAPALSPTATSSTAAIPSAAATTGTPARRDVLRAEGLAVGWPGGPVLLEGLDLEVRPGRALAIVGPSGVGKTTLLLTLAGVLPPRAGRVTLDAVDLADLDRHEVAQRVTLTAEDAHVFATTVLENIRVGRGDVTPGEALELLERAGLGAWARALPEGVDTMLGTDAATISGGERRRLLLARALAGPADLLLLDEPGEHLDPVTADRLVTDLLRGGRAGSSDGSSGGSSGGPSVARVRGTVVATHRLHALAAADEVIVLDHRAPLVAPPAAPPGHAGAPRAYVRSRGTHDRLLTEDPAYAWSLAQEQEDE